MNRTRLLLLLTLLLLLVSPGRAAPGPGGEPLLTERVLRLEAGEYAAFSWDPERHLFTPTRLPPDRDHGSPEAEAALARVPAWLADRVEFQFARLAEVAVRVPGPARLALPGMSAGGHPIFRVGGVGGGMREYATAPVHLIMSSSEELEGGTAGPIRVDVDGDGLLDQVRGTEEGAVVWRRNRGAPGRDAFLDFHRDPERAFPQKAGMAAHPAVCGGRLFLGNLDGGVVSRRLGRTGGTRLSVPDMEFAAPAAALFGERVLLVVGHADGGLWAWWGAKGQTSALDLVKDLSVGACATPCFGDVDGDGDLDLLVGDREGGITLFANVGTAAEPRFEADESHEGLSAIDLGESASPAAGDLDGDGHLDLVVGNQAGELRLFMGPDLAEVEGALSEFDLGELSAPALYREDGDWRLLVGRLEGDLLLHHLVAGEDRISIAEHASWSYTPDQKSADLEAFYERSYFAEDEQLYCAEDDETVRVYADLLAKAPEHLVDEIAFTLAHTPTEVLRVMARLGQADLLEDNAQAVYDMAGRVAYAEIREVGDQTTLAYARAPGDFVVADPEIYYWWVVHPRLLYEIPARIDARWWERDAEARGLTDSEWWQHAPDRDVHAPTPESVFWRRALVSDDRFGGTLFESAGGAETLRDALFGVHRFVAKDSGGVGLMRFGYETQDLQPWLIYAKRYGSCGEHSLIGAACARTMLVPTSVVGCRGEDHQWNEWWDTDGGWHHWDCCGKDNVDRPWGSTEGREHKGKTVSTVVRWRADDLLEATTTTVTSPEEGYTSRGTGYTDTAHVRVHVIDPERRPVDGALVLVKSHWNNRNLLSIWGYTDGNGTVEFDLGYEPNGGYTIEAFTPLGSVGVTNFPVEENQTYQLDLVTPRSKPPFAAVEYGEASGEGEPGRGLIAELVRAELRPPNLFTARRYRIGSYLTTTHGYHGTRDHEVPVDPGKLAEVLILTPEAYEEFAAGRSCTPLHRAPLATDGRLAWPAFADQEYVAVISNRNALFAELVVKVKSELAEGADTAPPEVTLEGDSALTVRRGGKLVLAGQATDDLKLTRLTLYCSAWGARERDVTEHLDRGTGRFEVPLDTGAGGPIPAGKYEVRISARDSTGKAAAASLDLIVTPARVFTDQVIRQDEPQDPLARCSWIYGPFDLDGTDRFLLIRTKSLTPDFDMDMYLYRDKNGNGRLDGKGEQLQASTSPTAMERIYLEKPPAGTYWLYCQGFKLKDEEALLDVEVFPAGKPAPLTDFSPAGFVREAKRHSVTVAPWAAGASISLEVEGGDSVSAAPAHEGEHSMVSEDTYAEGEHRVTARLTPLEGEEVVRTWTFTVDRTPPQVTLELFAEDGRDDWTVVARVADADPEVRVFLRHPIGGEKRVPAQEGVFEVRGGGAGRFAIVARDRADNETVREFTR